MKKKIRRNLEARKRKVLARLEAALDRPTDAQDLGPVMSARRIQYELATKTQAIAHGGVGAVHMLARKLGLPQRIVSVHGVGIGEPVDEELFSRSNRSLTT